MKNLLNTCHLNKFHADTISKVVTLFDGLAIGLNSSYILSDTITNYDIILVRFSNYDNVQENSLSNCNNIGNILYTNKSNNIQFIYGDSRCIVGNIQDNILSIVFQQAMYGHYAPIREINGIKLG